MLNDRYDNDKLEINSLKTKDLSERRNSMGSIDVNPSILSKLQQDSNATKKMAKLLKRKLIRYSKQNSKKERMKIQKDLLQYLLPELLKIITKGEEILKYLDLSEASFDGIDVTHKNFKDSNANIDPQTIQGKTLFHTNLKGVDLSHANFTGVDIKFANLEDTNAQIDPQLIKYKFLYGTNAKGCTFINLSSLNSLKREPADFTGVDIRWANLENTNAQIDPQLIENKSLKYTNVKGLDLSHANFNGVYIQEANLEGTGAIINPHTVRYQEISGANLNYCTLIDDGNLEGIYYDKDTSLKHVKFSTLESHNIYHNITENIRTACNPITTLKKALNKVLKK